MDFDYRQHQFNSSRGSQIFSRKINSSENFKLNDINIGVLPKAVSIATCKMIVCIISSLWLSLAVADKTSDLMGNAGCFNFVLFLL